MRIFIFGGTTEGRVMAEKLTGEGHAVTVSVATEIGAEELAGIPCRVHVGRKDALEMKESIRGFELVIDATLSEAMVTTGKQGRQKDGEGNGTLLQYSCLENPMDRGAW